MKTYLSPKDAVTRACLWTLTRYRTMLARPGRPLYDPGVLVRKFNGVTGATVGWRYYKRLQPRFVPFLSTYPAGLRRRAAGPFWEVVA